MDDEFDLWEQNILEMITDTLNVEEDYFAQPEVSIQKIKLAEDFPLFEEIWKGIFKKFFRCPS